MEISKLLCKFEVSKQVNHKSSKAMEKQVLSKESRAMVLIDMIQTVMFGAMAVTALVGAVVYKAWWHLGTAAICAAIAKASYDDIKKETKK